MRRGKNGGERINRREGPKAASYKKVSSLCIIQYMLNGIDEIGM